MVTEPVPEDVLDLGKGYRLTLTPAELQVQSRLAGGAWIPGRLIRYGEIRAVYRYERRNWSPLVVTATGWLMFVVLALAASEATGIATWARVVIAVAPLLLVAVAGYRVYAVLSPMLKVDAFTGPLVVPARRSAFFQRLGQRVREAAEIAAATPAAAPSPASAAAPWMTATQPAGPGGFAAPPYSPMGSQPVSSGVASPYGTPAAPPTWTPPGTPASPSPAVVPPVPGSFASTPSPAEAGQTPTAAPPSVPEPPTGPVVPDPSNSDVSPTDWSQPATEGPDSRPPGV